MAPRSRPAVEGTPIRVHYDAGWGNHLTLRGNKPPFDWSTGVPAIGAEGNVWTFVWPRSSGVLQLKPLLNDRGWSIGGNYRLEAGAPVDIYPFFSPVGGTLHKVHDFHSPQLDNSRTLIISLPPSYAENPLKRYPVLYMHDGQNVFEDATSFTGVSWGVDRTRDSLVVQGLMDEIIVVGISNMGTRRGYEYTAGPASERGGGADSYGRFLVETVKPWVDRQYRTLPGREDTALMGSSLGGLISFYLGTRYPHVFSKVACLSSAFGWNGVDLVSEVERWREPLAVKFYIDAGTHRDPRIPTLRMKEALEAQGYVQGEGMYHYEDKGGRHTEASWAARVHRPLRYLFPWQSASSPR
ncbi:alpha/beta hydrolase [Hyalangium sp.]|uniref:alpha/beta hydrolase n=1 Tax=Hyalangium sp. TaxID=2028555 RepID=UPI002D66DFCC|nr:alpha/beta hydrolase-fold protein [Hyalangium sp.]HYI01129.1 alpha/beta hydrolase-fold protein [Hyalangium sp.]